MRPFTRLLAASLLLLALLPPAAARPGAGDEERLASVPDAVRIAMMRGELDEAERLLAREAEARPEEADFLGWLRGIALVRAGRLEEAVALLAALESEHPEGAWIRKLRFLRAEALGRLGRWADAERIWEAEAARLHSDERKAELAGLLLSIADELSTEPEVDTPEGSGVDWARAAELYRKAIELDAPAAIRERARFRIGVCLRALGSPEAAAAFRAYRDEFGPGSDGFADFGLRPLEASLEIARSELAAGLPEQARRTLEDLAREIEAVRAGEAEAWGGIGERIARREADALARLEGEALFAIGATWTGADAHSHSMAAAAYARFLERHPRHPDAPEARYETFRRLRGAGRADDALEAADALLAAPAPDGPEARERDAELRREALFEKGALLRDQGRLREAIETWSAYVGSYPTGASWSAAQQGIVDAEYGIALAHRSEGELAEARAVWTRFLADHPLDRRAPSIALELGELRVEEADALAGGEDEREAELLRAAIEQWRRVVAKHAGTEVASRALFRIGEVAEDRLGALDEALAAYRDCSFGTWAPHARRRIERMTEPALAVVTERTWRTDETPRITAEVRNVEALTVELYPLDLEAYFRKHRTHRRIEDLDVDLIEPARVLEVPIEGYERWAPIRRVVELPIDEPGTWVVAVTSGELRATTLVVVSDLDVVVKSSRREVFVFAEDMRLAEPAPGVEVLVVGVSPGDPSPELRSIRTGEDGVARLAFDELEAVAEVRVFAARGGHCASDGVGLEGLRLARGLSPRGHVSTDRPAYRPGQTVRWRAILREVEGQAYAFEEGQAWRVEVADPGGRVIRRERLELSRFGTLSGEVALPALAPLGSWTVRCARGGDRTWSGSFEVAEYEVPKVELALDVERDVYYRGEPVEVEITAAWYWGEPVASVPLVALLPDGRRLDLETDAEGRARFSFDTRELPSEGAVGFAVELPSENVRASESVWLAVQGFSAALAIPNEVVLAGDGFAAELSTTSPAGEPVARDLVVSVLRREADRGRWREVLVLEREVATSAEDGRARVALALERGGHHVVRARGTDRFGNPVSAEATVFVSGEDDAEELRLLADESELSVGETARLRLVNRAGSGLALVTFEGEAILGYRIVPVDPGTREIELELGHEHFPNVAVAVALMDGNRFHQAATELEVRRRLSVAIRPAEPVVRPGGTAEVELLATDQLGRPVSAELALAVVDEGLFQLYPDGAPDVRAFFEEGTRRDARMRTATSCTFRYEGRTATISADVLAEEERREAELAWEEDRERLLDRLGELGYSGGASLGAGRAKGEDDFDAPLEESAVPRAAARDVVGIGGGAGGKFGMRGRGGLAKGLGADGRAPRARFAETAFWTPSVVTDAEGRATLRFEMPEQATRWRITCRGVGEGTLVGQATAELVTRSDFFVELRAPVRLTEGDRPRFVARIHAEDHLAGTVELRLRTTVAGETRTLPARLELAPGASLEHVFEPIEALPPAGEVAVELEARLATAGEGEIADALARRIPIRPWGLEVADAESGTLRDRASFALELPAREAAARALVLRLGPGLDHLLVEEALGGGPRPLASIAPPSHDGAASELLGVCEVLALLARSEDVDGPEARELRERAGGLVASLVAAQRPDGGWGWIGARGPDVPETSGRAMLALARARALGLEPPAQTIERGLHALREAFREASQRSDERKAILVVALAAHGEADFGAINRLHRLRGSLSPAALAHTALALVEAGHARMASEVAAELEARGTFPPGERGCAWPTDANDAWSRSPIESTALAVLALERALPGSDRIDPGIEWLLARRPWPAGRARGLAVAALAVHRGAIEPARGRMRVAIAVGGRALEPVELSGDEPSAELEIPIEGGAGEVRVELELSGRGVPHFAAVLSGFARDVDRRETDRFRLYRHELLAPAPTHLGREVPIGFSVLARHHATWRNRVEHLPVGESTEVEVGWSRLHASRRAAEREDFLVLEVPIPSGARVVAGSVRGGSVHDETRDGRLVIHVGPEHGGGTVRFRLVGSVPGDYRALPATLRSAHEPGLFAVHEPTALAVLPRGAESPDPYRPTPDELYHLGAARFEAGDREGARELLAALWDEHGDALRDDPLRETARMLLFLALDRSDAPEIVRYFEVLREKSPELWIPFEDVLRVGVAYRELEEHERALHVFRATVEETFGKDLKVAGTLEGLGERAAALDVMERLWREFPDLAPVVETYLALSDQLLLLAPGAAADASLRRAGRDRASLARDGILLLKRFLTAYADDPLAPEAGLNLVGATIELADHETASELAARMAELWEEPRFADAFLYTRAVAEWHLGRDEVALELLERIASARYPAELGETRPSENRELALYILGQIHHARRDPERAIDFYEEVDHLFQDAREAIAGFREKRVAVEEVTAARPGETVSLALEHRNVREAELLVYEVDLMTLYLRERNLANVTAVNLAGIAPAIRRTVALGEGLELRERETAVELELGEPGAYLVICRGDELFASGLVLVSELELLVDEDRLAGRMRIQAVDRGDGRYVRDVDVRVIGSENEGFVSGSTDPRGLFVADGVRGTATVIARLDREHYAFHRGTERLGPAGGRHGRGGGRSLGDESRDYFEHVRELNRSSQEDRQRRYRQELSRDRAGVQVKQVQ